MFQSKPLPDSREALLLLDKLSNRSPSCRPRPVDGPVVLYGAGKLGRLAAELFTRLGIPIAYAIDRACLPKQLLLGKIPVYRLDNAPVCDRSSYTVAVSVALSPISPIRAHLRQLGWTQAWPFYDIAQTYADRVPLNNGWFTGPLTSSDYSQVAHTVRAWEDSVSRAAYLQFLAWRIHREEWGFDGAPVLTEDRYFIPPILAALRRGDSFLDAGAYDGSISQRFIDLTQGAFGQVYAIEPDRNNMALLRTWRETLPADRAGRVVLLSQALSDISGTLPFSHGYGLASRLMTGCGESADATTLDKLGLSFTFAKLHLEGEELGALIGGMCSFAHNRPIIAVTADHNRDGLWRVPTFLIDRLPEYRALFRLHAWCGTGAVVYMIPNERWKS